MKTLLYANRAEPKSISVISILLLAAAGDITKLRCMHRECYIFASQNLWYVSCFFLFFSFFILCLKRFKTRLKRLFKTCFLLTHNPSYTYRFVKLTVR